MSGVTVKLPNGYAVSIQHSERHCCGESTVEVAVMKPSKKRGRLDFVDDFPWCESSGVATYVTGKQLLDIISWANDQ